MLQVFNSLDELKNRIQEIANADGFVIVTRRSKKTGGRTGRVWLECDRGGEHQTTATLRKAGSKKTGCPFYLLAVRNHPYETWEIKDGKIEHNHELCEDLSAHAFVRRFTPSEMKLIEQLTAQNMESRKIFQTIRKQDPDRFHVLKDVQNVVAKIRAEQRQGLTPMQSLENILINNDFIYETREEPGTEIVTEIFFLHRDSRCMWRAFPHVMLIDATYKTNIYNMPFIQIVGMTPTNKSFIIAHAVVSKERGDNFVWVLQRVKSMLDECMEPRVILTDRDLALMGACAKVFPNASRLLCRWHIQQNVMKHCKGAFTDDDWKKFLSFWGTLIESPSILIYDYHLRNMRKRLAECKRSRVFKYVYDNWLKDYKEMFVFAWTDKRRNFGNRTTNRVESQHANLKRYVEDRSSLDRVVGCVHDIVETQFGEIRKTFRESIEKTMNHHKHPMFQHLLGKVSHTALDLLSGEAIRKLDVLERFHSSCGCQMWHSCGLPCACRIEKYMREERPIQLEDIDVFWRKLNFQSCKLIDDDVDVVEELNIVRQQLESHPPAQQKSLMSKIKAVLTPKKSTKKPPVVQQNTRGRPTTKQVQQRLDEASRIDEELRRSSFGDANTCFEGSRQSKYDKPRHSSYVPSQASQQSVIRSQKPKASLSRSKSSKKKETRDAHGFPLIIGDEYVGIIEQFKDDIPLVFHPYVSCIRDVMPDGHCGFRSVAVGLGMDQSSWGLIRRHLVQEMDQNKSIWFPIFEAWDEGYFYTHRQGLIWDSVSGCPPDHWMDFPLAGLLIAQTYGIGVHLLTTTMGASSTFFPILSPPANQQPLFITLAHVNENHFIHVKLEGDYPMPPAHGLWLDHRTPHTEQWEDMYLPRLEWYTSIMNPPPRSNPSLNYIDSDTEE